MDGGGYPIYQQQQQQQLHPNLQQRRNVNLNLLQNQQQFAEQNAYLSNQNFGIDAPPKATLSRLRSRVEKYRTRTHEQSLRHDRLVQKETDEQNKEALILQKQAMDSKTKKTTKTKNNSSSTTATTNTDKQSKAIESNAQMQHSVHVHMPQRNMKRAIEDVENEPSTFEPPTKLSNIEVKQQPTSNINDAADISGQFTDFPDFLVSESDPHDNTFNDLINDLQDINPEFLESSMIDKTGGDSSILDILNDKPKDRNLAQFQSDFVKDLEEQNFNIPPSPTQKPSFNMPASNGSSENNMRIPGSHFQFPGKSQPQPQQQPPHQFNRMHGVSMQQNMQTNQILPPTNHLNHNPNGHPTPQQTSIPNQQNHIMQQGSMTMQQQNTMAMQNQVPVRPQMPQTMLQQRQLLQQPNPISQQNNQPQRMQFQQNMPINRQQQMNFMSQRNAMQQQQHQGIPQQQQTHQSMQPQTQSMQSHQSMQPQPIQSLQKQAQQLQPGMQQPTQPLQSMQSQNMQQPQTSSQQYPNSMSTINRQGLPLQRVPHPQVRMNQIPIQQQNPQARMMNQQIGFNQQHTMGNGILPQQAAQQRTAPMQNHQMQNQMSTMHQNGSIRQPMAGMTQEQMLRHQQINGGTMIRQQMNMNQQQQQSYPQNRMGQVPMQRNPNQMQMQQPVINNQQSMVMNRAGIQQGMMPQQSHHPQQQMQPNQRVNQMPPIQQQQYMSHQSMHGQQQQQPMAANNVGNTQNMGLDFLDNLPMGSGNEHDLLNSLGNDHPFINFLS